MHALLVVLSALQVGTEAVDRAVIGGIEGGIYPAAVVVVGTSDRVIYAHGYGHFTWDVSSPVPDPDSSLFDLASLTKVLATTPALMILADRGRVALRRPVVQYLPGFAGEGKEAVTVRHLLQHRSGLRAFLPLNELAATAAEARELVLREPLRWSVGGRVEYSDLNAMLLGWIVETAGGMPLDQFVAREVYEPLDMRETRFRPPANLRPRIVPVGLWRGHAVSGSVHDQNAARFGGISGHAGLYATGSDVARYAQMMLRRGTTPDGLQLIRTGTIDLFLRRGSGNRALGWEMRDTTSSDNSGTLFSANAYGHTGYTGTSIWIDPDRDLFVVLLTNRVFAPRAARSISGLKRVRGDVADAAVRLLEGCVDTSDGAPGC